jgi:hypothetical protein
MLLQLPCLGERFKTAVVGFFHCRRETAAGQLFHLEMVLQAVAADAFVGAGVIRASTMAHIFLFFAFHNSPIIALSAENTLQR